MDHNTSLRLWFVVIHEAPAQAFLLRLDVLFFAVLRCPVEYLVVAALSRTRHVEFWS